MRIQDAILYGSKRGSGSGPTPSGSIEISENGTYDVTDKAEAVVDVEPDLTTKQITQNGTYSASSDNKDGYSSVTVAVPSADLTTKNITQNGTYQASSDNADGYSAVTVAVPQPLGTKQVTISQNGTTTEDVEDYENAQITVNVQPNLTTKNITQNGTYAASGDSADGYSSVTVNVSGGASNEDAIIDGTLSGAYENSRITHVKDSAFRGCTGLTSVSLPNVTSCEINIFSDCTNLTNISLPKLETGGNYLFSGLINLTGIVELPSLTEIQNGFFYNGFCKAIDIGANVRTAGTSFIGNTSICSRSDKGYLVIRANSVVPASGSVISSYGIVWRPFILVPSALVNSYKSATNWSSVASYILPLEDYTTDGTTTGPLDPTKLG